MVCSVIGIASDVAAQVPQPGFRPSPLPGESGSVDVPPDISPNAEQWRYSFQNGFWWYITPEHRWLYWSQGRWVEHLPPGRSNTPPYLQPPMTQTNRWRRFGPTRRSSHYFSYPGYGVY